MTPYVLIVEDNSWQAQVLTRELTRAGLRCHVSSSALAAIDAIDDAAPAALVLDINLPAANGLALLHELRSHSDLAHIPVIICSNIAHELPSTFARDYHVVAVFDKATVHPGDIAVAVQKAVAHGG